MLLPRNSKIKNEEKDEAGKEEEEKMSFHAAGTEQIWTRILLAQWLAKFLAEYVHDRKRDLPHKRSLVDVTGAR